MNATDDNHEHIPASSDCVREVVTAALRSERVEAAVRPGLAIPGGRHQVHIDNRCYAVNAYTLSALQASALDVVRRYARSRPTSASHEPCPVCAVALGGVCMRCRSEAPGKGACSTIVDKPVESGDRVRLLPMPEEPCHPLTGAFGRVVSRGPVWVNVATEGKEHADVTWPIGCLEVEPRPFKVGDRVRLLAWEGKVGGLSMWGQIPEHVGTVQRLTDIVTPPNEEISVARTDLYWWPTSALELVEASP